MSEGERALVQKILRDLIEQHFPDSFETRTVWDFKFFRLHKDMVGAIHPIRTDSIATMDRSEFKIQFAKFRAATNPSEQLSSELPDFEANNSGTSKPTISVGVHEHRVDGRKIAEREEQATASLSNDLYLQAIRDATQVLEMPASPQNYIGKSIFQADLTEVQRYIVYLQKQLALCNEIASARRVSLTRKLTEELKEERKGTLEKKYSERGKTEDDKQALKRKVGKGMSAEHRKLLKLVIDMDLPIKNYLAMSTKELQQAIKKAMYSSTAS